MFGLRDVCNVALYHTHTSLYCTVLLVFWDDNILETLGHLNVVFIDRTITASNKTAAS